MGTSHLPATIDALVAALTLAGVKTWDGPVESGDFEAAVFVGYDGDPDGDFSAALADQEWAGSVGAKKRDETFAIKCAAVALTGGTDTKTGRDAVYGLLATVETTMRSDPGMGFLAPYVAEVKPAELFTEPISNGLQCRLVFTINVRTRV